MTRDLLIERWNPNHINWQRDAHWYDEKRNLNRRGDQPSIVRSNGNVEWYKDGKCHRNGDKPAIIQADGTMYWFRYGMRYRENGKPNVAYLDGGTEWYKGTRTKREEYGRQS